MKRLLLPLFSFLIVTFFFTSCYYDNQEEIHPTISDNSCDTTGMVSYMNDIVPILNNNCGTTNSCHNSNSSNAVLNNYTDIRSNAGLMVKAILHDPSLLPSQWMPNGGRVINKCSIKKIQAWVNQGRLNN